MVQSLTEVVWQFIIGPSNPIISNLPKKYKNMCPHKDVSMTVRENITHNSPQLERSECPSTTKKINKIWYIYTMK